MPGPDHRPEPGDDADVEEITDDIERTREEVGETVAALAEKFDVKQRAQQKVDETKVLVVDAVTDDRGAIKPALPVVAAAVATATILLGIIIWRRRR
ncbi:DUF3618 domain-containing protein [Mycolicibacterium diernhoferi]|uniref:DUF3618 domain-containing protein n=1 Tax=Mycolicibacterium diernhoferi TaxID=1801 RepID=A0A1Q4HHX4_9MYCO|nr:DUF3618 domain-containing protein [Mycolicibacterium diernhoferi]OJZ67134.1 hypothetical protein BRW64_07860 [Mycolicibacterium diernhoferi]OPE55658.1 hypothetical protein BV510_03980 [Mycolicibacterium diernhoferi]PEG53644.1 DUF3618 domain-containing protein [Mycolicibacterium diernhoferi]QYL23333.1 DUF3618 domain-containing protein [Mycolicibacterium diernhoferi]